MTDSIFDITVADCCTTLPTLSTDLKLSKVEKRLEEKDYHSLPVQDNGTVKGVVNYEDMLRKLHADPTTTNIEKVMHTPPHISSNTTLPSVARKRIDSGRRLFLVENSEEVVPEERIAFAAQETEELRGKNAYDLAEGNLIVLEETETGDEARSIFIEEDISQIPVIDANGKLTGILHSTTLLQQMKAADRMTEGEVTGEKESRNVAISSLTDPDCLTATDTNLSAAEAVQQMEEHGCRELVFVDMEEPVAILTVNDIIDYIASFEERSGVDVNIVGTDVEEEQAVLMRKAEHFVHGRTIGMVRDPQEFKVHVKKQRKDGKQHLYTINLTFFSNLGTIQVSAQDWDLLTVMDEAVEKLQNRVKKKVDRKRETSRSPRPDKKQ